MGILPKQIKNSIECSYWVCLVHVQDHLLEKKWNILEISSFPIFNFQGDRNWALVPSFPRLRKASQLSHLCIFSRLRYRHQGPNNDQWIEGIPMRSSWPENRSLHFAQIKIFCGVKLKDFLWFLALTKVWSVTHRILSNFR